MRSGRAVSTIQGHLMRYIRLYISCATCGTIILYLFLKETILPVLAFPFCNNVMVPALPQGDPRFHCYLIPFYARPILPLPTLSLTCRTPEHFSRTKHFQSHLHLFIPCAFCAQIIRLSLCGLSSPQCPTTTAGVVSSPFFLVRNSSSSLCLSLDN